MDVVGPPRDGRAQVVGRDVPVLDAVLGLEQGAVEDPYRFGIGEVDARLAIGVGNGEFAQLRMGFDQAGEIVAALMAIARVQGGF